MHTVLPVKLMFQSNCVPLQMSVVFLEPLLVLVLLKQLCSASANALTASDAYADTLYRSPSWICSVYCSYKMNLLLIN